VATYLAATATTADPWTGWLILAGLALLWAAGYVAACAIWPFTNCRRCKGTGKHRSPRGKAWRRCRRCKGTGTRIRGGRRVWTWLRNKEKEAQ
jgi:hypothetical protein